MKDVTKDSLTLTWEAPDSGQKGLTGYMIEKRTPDSEHWERVARVPALVKSHHVTGLPEGGTFYFRVFAENSTGLSNPAELKKPVEMKGKKGYYMKISQITTIQYTRHVIYLLFYRTILHDM